MIRVDPSPILFYFYFFIQSELVRVDPTRTDSPSWSGPTFVPAFCTVYKYLSLFFILPKKCFPATESTA